MYEAETTAVFLSLQDLFEGQNQSIIFDKYSKYLS